MVSMCDTQCVFVFFVSVSQCDPSTVTTRVSSSQISQGGSRQKYTQTFRSCGLEGRCTDSFPPSCSWLTEWHQGTKSFACDFFCGFQRCIDGVEDDRSVNCMRGTNWTIYII